MKSLLVILSILTFFSITPSMAQTVEDGWKAYDAGEYEKAKEIMLPLAVAGDASAMHAFGVFYEEGKAYQMDIKNAYAWYVKAASHGYVNAQITLMKRLSESDPESAANWGQKAVDQGSALARVGMWSLDLENTGREASPVDIACVLVMVGFFYKDWDYCD